MTDDLAEQMFINVFLRVDSKVYQPGDDIHGTVCLYVPKRAAGNDDFSGINLSLEGQETVNVPSLRAFWKHPLRTDCTEVVHLPSPLIPGQHEYPFCWRLPESLPCSMTCKSEGSTCQVQYYLTAYLSATLKPGVTVNNARQLIDIQAGNEISCTEIEGIIEQKMLRVKSLFKERGFVELGIDTEPIEGSTNSTIAVGIKGRNLSSVPVQELLVQWEETITWGKQGMEWQTQKVLAENTVLVRGLPSWKGKKGTKRNVIGTAESEISADRITTPLELGNARFSYNGELIKVHHSLKVTAVTKGKHATRPEFTALMEVRQPDILTPVKVLSQTSILEAYSNDHHTLFDAISPEIEVPQAVEVGITYNDPVFCQCFSETTSILRDLVCTAT